MALGFIFQGNGHNFLNGTGVGKCAHSFVANSGSQSPWGWAGQLGEGRWRVGAGTKLHAGDGIRATQRQLSRII